MAACRLWLFTPYIILPNANMWRSVDRRGLNPFWFGLSRGSKIGWMRFNSILFVVFAVMEEKQYFCSYQLQSGLLFLVSAECGYWTIEQAFQDLKGAFFANLSMMSSISASINTSGGIPWGPATFPVTSFCFTLWYSSTVNGPDGMSRLSKMVLISSSLCVIIGSFPSKFLKYSWHLLRRSCLWFPLMMPFIAFFFLLDYWFVPA